MPILIAARYTFPDLPFCPTQHMLVTSPAKVRPPTHLAPPSASSALPRLYQLRAYAPLVLPEEAAVAASACKMITSTTLGTTALVTTYTEAGPLVSHVLKTNMFQHLYISLP
jgi:hypothetical protein